MRSSTMRWFAAALLVGLVVCASGCPVQKVRQAAARAQRANDLKMIALAYHSYIDDHKGAPPEKADDLQPYLGGVAGPIAALSDGSLVVIYGVRIEDMKDKGTSNYVLGYESQVPASGGMVIMGDGSVQTVTAAAFAGMPQAAPAPKK